MSDYERDFRDPIDERERAMQKLRRIHEELSAAAATGESVDAEPLKHVLGHVVEIVEPSLSPTQDYPELPKPKLYDWKADPDLEL